MDQKSEKVNGQVNNLMRWGATLEAIAHNGIRFTPNPYDLERFEEVLTIAKQISGGVEYFPEANEPVVIDLRDDNDASIAARYVTPKIGISVAIADDQNRLLLVERAASKQWAPVGGYADVGYSAAEVAIKEAREEVGLQIEIVDLIAVFDGLQAPINQSVQYSIMFSARVTGGSIDLHPSECSDYGWFGHEDQLPKKLMDKGEPWLRLAFDALEGKMTKPYFDQPRRFTQ